MSLVQELLTLRVMGIPQSFVSPVGALFSSLVNPILAIGLLRRRPWAGVFAIAWYAFLSVIAVLVVTWLCYYHVAIDLATWPEQAISKILPVFLFVVMLLPRIKRVFTAQFQRAGARREGASPRRFAGRLADSFRCSTLLFLIVVCSNLVVNAADWGYRLMFESESLP